MSPPWLADQTPLPFQQAALDLPQTSRKQAWTTGKTTNTLGP